ncbi:MAG: toxin, partial [Actinobacteria bacterium]|nr:toxin [Actinomycetota bacterium]
MTDRAAPQPAADTDSFRVSPPSSSLPKGGGAIRGIGEKFSTNPVTGTSSVSVPIATSPGRAGFGPQLSITYDSGSGNGPFGFGWHLSLPAITRKTDRGLPTYVDADESDVFILAGAEDLVPLLVETANGWKRDTQTAKIGGVEYQILAYRPRTEGLFARIERWTRADRLDTFWRTISRDNVTTIFGKTLDSRIVDPSDPSRTFSWLICETYDDKGHVAEYAYQREDLANVDAALLYERNRRDPLPAGNTYIKRIVYGNTPSRLHPDYQNAAARSWMFEVVFDYGESHYAEQPPDADGRVFATATSRSPPNGSWPVRSDPFSACRAGFDVRTYRLCQRVLMFHRFAELGTGAVLVKSTDFTYASDASATFLTSVAH